MPPKKPKLPMDRAKPSIAATATAVVAEVAARSGMTAATTVEPPTPHPQPYGATITQTSEEIPEGIVEEVQLDQDGNETKEDEEGKITN